MKLGCDTLTEINQTPLFSLNLTGYSINCEINAIFLILIVLLIIVYLLYKGGRIIKGFSLIPVSFEFSIPSAKASYLIVRNYSTLEIAHKIFVELSTRKAAIPVDPDNDVIIEIYNSWYELFKVIRSDIKNIDGKTISADKNCEMITSTAIAILNSGLRPHLTQYQARFRRWYLKAEVDENNAGKTPQEIQKQYPEYQELVENIKQVSKELIDYKNQLEQFIKNEK